MAVMSTKPRKLPQYANALVQARQRRGLSQTQAARLVGCRTRQKIAGYERGERLPTLPRVFALAAAYELPVEQLYPALWAQVQAATQQRQRRCARIRKPTYVPRPNATTILALYPGTRKIGMAVFEALPSR
jgi:transcriptional regulator with XRE-family HTH domain